MYGSPGDLELQPYETLLVDFDISSFGTSPIRDEEYVVGREISVVYEVDNAVFARHLLVRHECYAYGLPLQLPLLYEFRGEDR